MIWIEYSVIAVCVLVATAYTVSVIRRSWSHSSCRSCGMSQVHESEHGPRLNRKQLVQVTVATACPSDDES